MPRLSCLPVPVSLAVPLGSAVLGVGHETLGSGDPSGRAGPTRPLCPLFPQSEGQDLDGWFARGSDRAPPRPLNLTRQPLPWSQQVGGDGGTVQEGSPEQSPTRRWAPRVPAAPELPPASPSCSVSPSQGSAWSRLHEDELLGVVSGCQPLMGL